MSEKKNMISAKVAICQMPVKPGRPNENTVYMIGQIKNAVKAGADIIVFPEMCVSGYLIGDRFEDESFIKDVVRCNEEIISSSAGITVMFGSLEVYLDRRGEDGRMRISNTAFVATDGILVGSSIKTLQPNYRIFDDDRHFYSSRKWQEESQISKMKFDCNAPVKVKTKNGTISVGVILCEDMWHDDYIFKPAKDLYKKGAEFIINLSASPWTWQKNRKRHNVVKNLSKECPIPLIYVNNIGIQNNGKNIVIFDGSSTVYDSTGDIVLEIPPFFAGSSVFNFNNKMSSLAHKEEDDVVQLYNTLSYGVKTFLETLPEERRKVVIGVSGGIDSALAAAFYVDLLGSKNVYLINMPSKYNSEETKSIAADIASSLNAHYKIIPIQDVVDAISKSTGVSPDNLTYENIQARVRMEILAAKAQQLGGVFCANGNKVEIGFGYGTMYGDIAGFLATFGDLVKREVYQLADYLNREVYRRQVIPEICFNIAPTAELGRNQRDPFDYGNLSRRGYHDEMIRAFTEFRRNPEWFLERYAEGNLEKELKLDDGTLDGLFPKAIDFINDLEHKWRIFSFAFIKRVQAPPIPIATKRAFGFDLRESILETEYTNRYQELKENILKNNH